MLKICDLTSKNEDMKKTLSLFQQQLETLKMELESTGREKEMVQREFIQVFRLFQLYRDNVLYVIGKRNFRRKRGGISSKNRGDK